MLAVENIRRWFDYWQERPGTGTRISSGGVKIIFSDTNTHFRGEENYRRSGVTDAMRIPKDAFYAHQVMWDGWVDIEQPRIHIIGHWNYKEDVIKPVYVVSGADKVELFLNGKSLGEGEREYHFLYTFKDVQFETGKLEAIGYDETGKECCRTELQTAGKPEEIRLTFVQSPDGWKADGADMVLLQVEVMDKHGRRCPLANDLIHFEVEGPAEWCGGILPVEMKDGLSKYIPGNELEGWLTRGETPLTPSYKDTKVDIAVLSAVAGANNEDAVHSFDDNELSEWKNDGKVNTAWITYHLERAARVDEVCLKLTGWRMRSYPLEIYAGDELIWSGETAKSLGYVHLKVKPVLTDEITVRLKGASKEGDAFGQIVEVAAPVANELDLFKAKNGDKANHELRIVEIEFKENLWQ